MYHFMSRLRRYTFLALIPGQPYLQKRAVTEREAIARMSCVDCHIVIVIVIVIGLLTMAMAMAMAMALQLQNKLM